MNCCCLWKINRVVFDVFIWIWIGSVCFEYSFDSFSLFYLFFALANLLQVVSLLVHISHNLIPLISVVCMLAFVGSLGNFYCSGSTVTVGLLRPDIRATVVTSLFPPQLIQFRWGKLSKIWRHFIQVTFNHYWSTQTWTRSRIIWLHWHLLETPLCFLCPECTPPFQTRLSRLF